MCVCEAELLIEQGLQFQIHHDSLHLYLYYTFIDIWARIKA